MRDSVAEHLAGAGEFRKIVDLFQKGSQPTESDRVLLAWAELEVGDVSRSLRRSAELLQLRLSPDDKARALAVFGRSKGNQGVSVDGLACLQKAAGVAETKYVQAEVLAHLVVAALGWSGVEPALAELPKLRRLSLESANRPALVDYHIVHARIAAVRGWWHRIERELAAAENLLSVQPHLKLQWRLRQVQASVAIMLGHLNAAIAHGEDCLRLADASGSRAHKASTYANLAHIWAVAGDAPKARRYLDSAQQLLEPNSLLRFATVNTGINVGLACGDNALVQRMIAEGESLAASSSKDSYYRLWFVLHKIKWLINHGDFEGASRHAEGALKPVLQLADAELADRLRLLRAEALFALGAVAPALEQFIDVASGRSLHTLEVEAELLRVEALLYSGVHPQRSRAAFLSARRILGAVGLEGPQADLERTGKTLAMSGTRESNSATTIAPLADALWRVGSMLRLGRYPRALAHETLEVLRLSGACVEAALIEAGPEGSSVLASFGTNNGANHLLKDERARRLVVGPDRDTVYEIAFRARDAGTFASLRLAVQHVTNAALAFGAAVQEVERPVPWPSEPVTTDHGMLVSADSMVELLGTTRRVATSNITVLITGETGTGKELLARALHDASPRHDKPFIPFNCSAVSRDMLDAQLFGYRKGAFTGANEAFQGVIRAAAGGTLFLDEIGEITPEVQPKLLRFLESGEIHPLGEPRPLHVDVRIVAATNADLEKLVGDGRFREDLFYRLNVVRLEVPPLRERREEIPPLVHYFLDKYSRESHKVGIRLADETMEYLILYKWPGNVRQLANELRRMLALAESNAVLMPEHLSHAIASSRRTIPASERTLMSTEVVVRMDQPMSAAMEHLERSMIQYALKLSGGRVEVAAERLGLSRKGLYLKRHRLHIEEQPVA